DDLICIDIKKRKLDIIGWKSQKKTEAEVKTELMKRADEWAPRTIKNAGILGLYGKMAGHTKEGASML
ncbi:MAG TPA: dihydroxy-acid dehydratase, partial [Bacillota bacterium]|nr:dihydroxy-acid dehydratase [Bacillota bacterium]